MYRLHCFSQSGHCFKVAFLLRALKQPYETVFVDSMHGLTRNESWRERSNVMGEVPILEDDSRRLTQSGSILTYLAKKHRAYGGNTPEEQQEILRWLFFDNHKFTSYFSSYRFAKAFGPTAPDPAVMAWLKGRMDGAYKVVDNHLASSPFIVGSTPTIADFSLCGYLFYPSEESSYDIQRFSKIAWLERVRSIPGWASPYDIMPGERIAPKW
ncbi:MAG: glutathione S-transferase [Leptolyngbyaceae cyanobacterium MO_188.B28]|nr:glutathione S-transferase [Leptolyngbyaceae cyanobacterium MO_188.B28]